MHELLLNQWFMYTSLFLNAVVAGHILWFAINISNSKILRVVVFTLGAAYAISCGGIFKAPGFIVNPQVIVFWLFVNSLIGLYMFASLFKTLKIHSLVTYGAMAMALIGSYTVFTGILEFGMRYMPAIMFFTICIYTGVGTIIYQLKMGKMQRLQKRLSYLGIALVFTLVSLNAFDTYQLVRETAYTDVSEGWEGGITEQQDELSN